MNKQHSSHPSINTVILLGETAKTVTMMGIVYLTPYFSYLIPFYLLIQTISSPVQGGKSDIMSRKQALLVTLFATGLAQVLVAMSCLFDASHLENTCMILVALFIQGRWGNISSVARATLSDLENWSIISFTIPISFSILSLPWMIALILHPNSNQTTNFVYVFCVVSFIVSIISFILFFFIKKRFVDIRDEIFLSTQQARCPIFSKICRSTNFERIFLHAKYEYFFISQEIGRTLRIIKKKCLVWIGALMFELAFHSVFYYLDEKHIFIKEETWSKLSLFVCFIIGCLVKPAFIKRNDSGILLGVLISLLGAIAQIIFPSNPSLWQGLLGFGSGTFLSSVYLFFLYDQPIDCRGKIVGAADSIQTSGEILGTTFFLLLSIFVEKFVPEIFILEAKFLPLALFLSAGFVFIVSFIKDNKVRN